MADYSHPEPGTGEWDDPDFCPFCGTELNDPGAGFIAHVEAAPTCRRRFEAWREGVTDDIGSEWGG
jgi:hypothetical protein